MTTNKEATPTTEEMTASENTIHVRGDLVTVHYDLKEFGIFAPHIPRIVQAVNTYDEGEKRIKELEASLILIRDKHIPNIENNANEGDKVICGTGAITKALSIVIPLYKFPKAEKGER